MNTFNWGLPPAASSYADRIDFGIRLIHWAMVGIFVLWSIFFIYLLLKYRKRAGIPAERDHEETPGGQAGRLGVLKSLAPDLAVTVFELILIVFYAIPAWTSIKVNFPTDEETVRIDVIAEQFAWNAHYPGKDGRMGRRDPRLVHFNNPIGLDREDPAAADDILTANEIHMPVGKRTLIRLSSKDVIHSFFVPQFRIKQDAVPGMLVPVWVEPTVAGVYPITCSQLCGFAHSLMIGSVVAESPAEFEAWLAAQAAGATAPKKTESLSW